MTHSEAVRLPACRKHKIGHICGRDAGHDLPHRCELWVLRVRLPGDPPRVVKTYFAGEKLDPGAERCAFEWDDQGLPWINAV